MSERSLPRLFVEGALAPGEAIRASAEQAHYLRHVMRRSAGDFVVLFNGRDGEWRARMSEGHRRGLDLEVETALRPQTLPPDLWLLFAPIKRQRIDFVAEKATELGVRRIAPIMTRRTSVDRVNVERLRAHAIEAAEQCGLLSVPDVRAPVTLEHELADWPHDRQLLFCDEAGEAPMIADALSCAAPGPWAVLTGPEGGFDDSERRAVRALPQTVAVSLGPRIMRADTAALAALALWQALRGDWRGPHGP